MCATAAPEEGEAGCNPPQALQMLQLQEVCQQFCRAMQAEDVHSNAEAVLQATQRLQHLVEPWLAQRNKGYASHLSPGSSPAAISDKAAFSLAEQLCQMLQTPHRDLYQGPTDGDLSNLADVQSPPHCSSTQQHLLDAVAVGLTALAHVMPAAVPHLQPAPCSTDLTISSTAKQSASVMHPHRQDQHTSSASSTQPAQDTSRHRPLKPGLLIEVLDDDQGAETLATEQDTTTQQQLKEQQLAQQALLVALTWLPDPGLPAVWLVPEELPQGQSQAQRTPGSSSPAMLLLRSLASSLPSTSSPQRHSAAQSVQALLSAYSHTVLPDLRRTLSSSPSAWAAQYSPQDVFRAPDATVPLNQRLLVARQAAALIRCLHGPALSGSMAVAVPVALAAVQDASPVVAAHGLWALHHIATKGGAVELRWQSELLLDTATRVVVGCQDCLWRAACVCAVTLVTTLVGPDDPRAPGCHVLMTELLREMERHSHQQAWRHVFLDDSVLHTLIKTMGLTTLRHTSRLLPLLLEWLQAYDLQSRALAAKALLTVVEHTWPRTPAHASELWHHMSALFLREASTCLPSGCGSGVSTDDTQPHTAPTVHSGTLAQIVNASPAAEWAVKVCRCLASVGDEACWQAVSATHSQLEACDQTRQEPVTAAVLAARNPALRPALEALVQHMLSLRQVGGTSQ